MKYLLTLFLLVFVGMAYGQTTAELKEQLKKATTSKERMLLNYSLGKAYLKSDVDKALDYSKTSNQLANQLKNYAMSASSAYLIALGYERKRDKRNQEVWLKSAYKFAKQAGDSDLIIRSVEKRSGLAKKERDYREAYQIVEEAMDYFIKSGVSLSDMESKFELQKTQLQRERKQLEAEKNRLEGEIVSLIMERDEVNTQKSALESRQKRLRAEQKEAEEEISKKTEELASVAEEKEMIEQKSKVIRAKLDQVTKEALADSLALEQTENDLLKAKAVAKEAETIRNYSILGGGFLAALLLLIYFRFRAIRRARKKLAETNKIIEEERKRSDELLLNILPAPIAEELKEYGKAKARKYQQVTVLFSDFKNFTRISEALGPEELVEELDKCFKAFDFIISQYPTIEKIKTIGDAYMCASGLSNSRQIPKEIVQAGLEMQEFLNEQKQEKIRLGKPFFEARIGIHTGPVVAGVVGVNKFAYDIWGDTVNIAARMESNSMVGRVNISESTYRLVKYNFECEHRGKIHAKNKGEIDMYYVKKQLQAVPV